MSKNVTTENKTTAPSVDAPDSIIRKIQKLLELANSPNENEAASAQGRAQELLQQYNLEVAIVKETAVAGGTVVIEEKREETKVNRSAAYQWQRDLWKTLATANFCFHWVMDEFTGKWSKSTWSRSSTPVYKKRHVILGRQSNVLATNIMGEYLCDTLERLLPYPNTERLSRSAISWRIGCSERLIQRISKQVREARAASEQKVHEAGTSTALVLASVYDKEYQANYDARHGEGAWADRQRRNQEWDAEMAARTQTDAEAEALEQAAEVERLAAETPAAREKRLKKEANDHAKQVRKDRRANATYMRQQDRESNKRDWSAYRKGQEVGDSINLSKQVGDNSKRRLS